MAGTRLTIIATFLGPFVGWVALSVLTSLRDDLLWRRLVKHLLPLLPATTNAAARPGAVNLTSLLLIDSTSSSSQQQQQQLPLPPLTVVTASTQVLFWESALRQQLPLLFATTQVVGAVDAEAFRRTCEHPTTTAATATITEDGDLWICEFFHDSSNAMLSLTNDGAAVFYPTSSLSQRATDFGKIFPQQQQQQRSSSLQQQHEPWRLTVLLDGEIMPQWKEVVQQVDQWLLDHAGSFFDPCFDASSKWKVELALLDHASQKGVHLTTESIVNSLPSKILESDAPHAILYVLSSNDEEGIRIVDAGAADDNGATQQSSTLVAFGDSLLFAIAHPNTIESSLGGLIDQVLIQCLGIPTDNVALSGSGAVFYEKLFYYRKLSTDYQTVTRLAVKVQRILQELPASVDVPTSVTEKFFKAVEFLQETRGEAAQGYLSDALDSMAQARLLLRDVQTDPLLAEPPDFPLEQYMAIFAPLLFPLLVPMLATLVREYKRYRNKLREKKHEGRSEEQ